MTVQVRIRSSSSPAAANAASRRSVTSRRIRYESGFQRNEGTSYSGSPSIGFGSIASGPRAARRMLWWWKSPCTSVARPTSSDA